ncbi:MAG TPA: signal peptidase I, partial [Symbiobacteriaceae bacterium]|nr:signal peptidase I [Symbiobacteriaceae bacterium]
MRRLGQLFAVMTWLLIGGSLIIITGGLFGRPLLLAAVPTGSMLPVLKPGDLIVVLPTWSMGAPGLDDVVVFKTPQDQNWIVHRIIDGNGTEGFVTMGDANPVSDPQRVFPKDIAGIVPQAGGKALRLPRMGAFRFANGPLSSPVVAGVALILGIYLLLMDASPEPRQRRFARSRTGSQRSRTILHAYAGLAVTAFLTTLIPAWTLSSDTDIAYEIVESRSTRATKSNRYLRGEEHKETVVIKNPSPLPLMVVFATADAHVHYEPWSA